MESAGLSRVVETVRNRSFEIPWSRPISFLFIDGLHDYLNVSRDFLHFQNWLAQGSYVAFHDYGDHGPDVRAFVDDLLASGAYQTFQLVDSLMVLEKNMDGTEEEALEPQELADRLERQDRGIAVLRDILRDAIARSRAELAERDKMITDLQQELFLKVDERDGIIRELQAELHQKVEECNRIIRELQTELHDKVRERDTTILNLHSELLAKVSDRDRTILSLQEELHTKVGERDKIILELQSALEDARRESPS